MTGWVAKRFWSEAVADPVEGGFAVRLDQRPVKTPNRTPLIVPTQAMAQAIADEWQAQQGVVKPETMPCTRSANSALDKVAPQFDEVAGLLAAYGASDLLCYRAVSPAGLVARQAAAWDPLLDWAETTLGARLVVTAGVVHVAQPPEAIARLTARVHACSPFQLAALHDLVAITGSLVLALAVTERRASAAEVWDISRVDETWQAELWGHDDEAGESEAFRHAGLLHAGRFYGLCG
ncbi:ATP12 family protein [Paracoccaceae bacterium Fryx2]|nr:ATP12 family protein [Paracoccaceae bacterium Fryx2]